MRSARALVQVSTRLRSRPAAPLLLAIALVALVHAACSTPDGAPGASDAGPIADATPEHVRIPYESSVAPPVPRVPVHAEAVSTRADVQALMFAAGEMQTSGEPFASGFAGRNLAGYDRYYLPTDQYLVHPKGSSALFVAYTDLFGFSTAVESYEYSKYHMNMVTQQTTAGVSLANGPLVQALAGASARDKLRLRVVSLLTAAGTGVGGFAVVPPPANNPMNDLGFPGLWPTFAPFESFDTTMAPDVTIAHSCTTSTGYGGLQQFGANAVPVYECNYNSLHLTDALAQEERVTGPGVLGFATWKEALWAIDFTGRLHDANSNQVNAINPADGPKVGTTSNTVVATDPPTAKPGTYIGSTPLEGMWGLMMLAEMDNTAEWLLSTLTTNDGAALSGFASKAEAIAYDYTSPLRWFPAKVQVTEDLATPYPLVTSLSIADATSRSVDLAGLLRGEALFFGMTDARNPVVGQDIGLTLTFDGDPFAADNGLADGEETAHDRALAVLRVAFVNLDRMHTDPNVGVTVDSASVSAGVVTKSANVTTSSLAHVVIALRTALMGLNGAISQYGAPDPDPARDAQGILNGVLIHPGGADAGAPPTFSARVRQLLVADAAFVRDTLTRPDGSVVNGAAILGGTADPVPGAATLESQTSALRALVEGFLVTSDPSFRDRARAVATRLDKDFYSAPARMYRGVAGGPDEVHMTPERFAWLQSALRETYKSLHVEGDAAISRDVLEDRIARVNKLYLNGWDDLDGNQSVDTKTECLAARMQLAEQALTGELGHDSNGFPASGGRDRDSDCVPELAHAKTASVLAREVFFHSP